jgi:hypothetical protein
MTTTLPELLDDFTGELSHASRRLDEARRHYTGAANTYRLSTTDPAASFGERRRLRARRLEASISLATAIEAYDALEDLIREARHLELTDPAAGRLATTCFALLGWLDSCIDVDDEEGHEQREELRAALRSVVDARPDDVPAPAGRVWSQVGPL